MGCEVVVRLFKNEILSCACFEMITFDAFSFLFLFFFFYLFSRGYTLLSCADCFSFQFYEELLDGTDSGFKPSVLPSEPLNKKTKFSYSDEEEDDGDSNADEVDHDDDKQEDISNTRKVVNANDESAANETSDPHIENDACHENQKEQKSKNDKEDDEYHLNEATVQKEPPAKSIDKLIEDELKELGDRSKVSKLQKPDFDYACWTFQYFILLSGHPWFSLHCMLLGSKI